jgi:hypothetical protein
VAAVLLQAALGCAADAAPVKEWTIMMYMNGDNNLEEFALDNFLQMSDVGSTPQVNVVVQLDRIPGYVGASPDYDDWTQTLRFYVAKGTKPKSTEAILDLGELDMGDPKTLADFITWCRKEYPAKKYMLVIWNHGQGWRFFETAMIAQSLADKVVKLRQQAPFQHAPAAPLDQQRILAYLNDTTQTPSATRIKALSAAITPPPEIPANRSVNGAVRYVSSDETSGTYLYNAAIQNVLESQFQTNLLDIIGFDACLMSMVETAYAMRNSAKVMVASEELEAADGWNYPTWLAALTAKPQMNAEELGKVLVDSYAEQYKGHNNRTTLAATRLGQINTLATNISNFAGDLMRLLPTQWAAIKDARYRCFNYAPGYGLSGIDLAYFVQQALASLPDDKLQASGTTLLQQLEKAIVCDYAGTDRQNHFGSKGLSIYFPHTLSFFQADPDASGYDPTNTVFPVEFVRTQRWAEFLRAYYQYVKE